MTAKKSERQDDAEKREAVPPPEPVPPEEDTPAPGAKGKGGKRAAENDASAPATEAAEPPTPPEGEEEPEGTVWHEQDNALRDMMAQNFIEYASYVLKDRAIPDIDDGLKPVQRRILHCLFEIDDGRFHKVANVIGQTMRFHPHGDASIGDALVVLANKEYFIDRQGNFGNIFTGDQASAARYIECRLSNLAREVLFNPEITEFVDSYDGRNREPVTLPAKVPALLMLGSDGIGVGMSTRIMPHNFAELLKAQIAILRDEPFACYPDFLTGGIMDVKDYADGAGRIRVRARIEVVNDKTLVIRDIPPGTSTESIISSVEDAARRGKLKIASINDYTAELPEIEITLPRGVYAEETVTRLYGYTDCEVSITSALLVIQENRPVLKTVSEVLRHNTAKLLRDLKRELEIAYGKLEDRFHEKTLAQIFIENRIYKRIEKCETWEKILAEVRDGLDKFRDQFRRDVTDADIEKLLQLQIRRISLFDMNKNRQELDDILKGMEETQDNLRHMKRFTIAYIKALLEKYGTLFPRRTQIADLAELNVREVALKNIKVGHDRTAHFAGSEVKNSNKGEEPLVCTEFDRLVLMRNDGVFKVIPIPERAYVGPTRDVFIADKNQLYSMIYRDRKTNVYFAKRFRITSYIMDKEYETIPENCIIEALYTTYGIVVHCEFAPRKYQRVGFVDLNFDEVPIRNAGARGFKIADHEIEKFTLIKRGSAVNPDGTPVADGGTPAPDGGTTPPPATPPGAGGAPDAENEPTEGKADEAESTTATAAAADDAPPAARSNGRKTGAKSPAPDAPGDEAEAAPARPAPEPPPKRGKHAPEKPARPRQADKSGKSDGPGKPDKGHKSAKPARGAKAEPVKPEPARAEPAKPSPKKAEPPKAEEPAKAAPPKVETPKAETKHAATGKRGKKHGPAEPPEPIVAVKQTGTTSKLKKLIDENTPFFLE